ncbi:MAG: 50S ribosomal protein L35 [Acidobacteriota bacterium]
MGRQKLKTHKGAAKRFRRTSSGKFLRGHACMRHNLTKKATKRKRQNDMTGLVSPSDRARVRKMLPYG